MKMKMMKVSELLLILSCVLSVSSDDLHEEIRIAGCSDSDGEFMFGLDGEEKYYSDFKNNRGVYPQPDFVDPFRYSDTIFQFSQNELETCRRNLKLNLDNFKNVSLQLDPPSLIIYPKDKVELGVQNTLICHVTGFYPAPVKVFWTKNGANMTEGTSINVPYPNKDGSYGQISRLDFIPQQGDMYSCRVTHPALTQPLTRFWDVEVQQPGVGPTVFCGLGLTVGLLGVASGTFFLIKGNDCS